MGIKDGWLNKELIEVCKEITDGSHFSPKSSPDYPYPYITVRDLDQGEIDFNNCKFVDSNDYKKLLNNGCKPNKGDLLFSKDGTVGKVALVSMEKEFVVLSSLAIIRPKNELIESELLEYILRHPDFLKTAIDKKTGVAIRRIILKNLKSINIQFPKSLTEQKQIVALLDQAFAAIDQAIANLEKNIKNAQELFQSKLNDVFSQRGEGWVEKSLGDLISISHGFSFKSKDFETNFEGDNPIVLTPGNFAENAKLYFNKKNTKRCISDYPKDYKFNQGELVVVMTDLSSKMKILGKPAIIETSNILHNQRIGRVIFQTDEVNRDFLYYYFQSSDYLSEIKNTATGTMVRHTAPKRILLNKINFPKSKKNQEQLSNDLKDLRIFLTSTNEIYSTKIKNLEELKKSILQKAFNGELT